MVVGESFAAIEYGCHDPRSEIPGKVGADCNVGESNDHGCICETFFMVSMTPIRQSVRQRHTNDKRRACGSDEWVGLIESGPDYDSLHWINSLLC